MDTENKGSKEPIEGNCSGSTAETAETVGPASLAALIHEVEADSRPTYESALCGPFRTLRQSLAEAGREIPYELEAEIAAFLIHAHDHRDVSAWGGYFGPMSSGSSESGELWEVPPRTMVATETLNYWRGRALVTKHPLMRARYADLVWELTRILRQGTKAELAMAHAAIDAYCEAVAAGLYLYPSLAVGRAERALALAVTIRDNARIARTRGVMLDLEDAIADDDKGGLWGFCFDAFIADPKSRVELTDSLKAKLISDLEARLARFVARPPSAYHPSGAESAALRLANYYRRMNQIDDAARVLRAYGEVVLKMHREAAPMIVSHSIEGLYNYYKSFGLHKEANALTELIRVAGEEAVAEMKEHSVTTTVSAEREGREVYCRDPQRHSGRNAHAHRGRVYPGSRGGGRPAQGTLEKVPVHLSQQPLDSR